MKKTLDLPTDKSAVDRGALDSLEQTFFAERKQYSVNVRRQREIRRNLSNMFWKLRCGIFCFALCAVIAWVSGQSHLLYPQNESGGGDSSEESSLRRTHRIQFPTNSPKVSGNGSALIFINDGGRDSNEVGSRPCRGRNCIVESDSGETRTESNRNRNCKGRNCVQGASKDDAFASTTRERKCNGRNCLQFVSSQDQEASPQRERNCQGRNCRPQASSDEDEAAESRRSESNCRGRNCRENNSDDEVEADASSRERTCHGRDCGKSDEAPGRNRRLCELKYAEYMTRIFPDDDDQADANDSEFHGRALADPGEYPHMTALGFKAFNNNSVVFKCGGSLISERFVITAAHCTNLTGQQPTSVRIGDLNLLVEEKHLEPQRRTIRRIHNHPQYRPDSYYNDIVLLELSEDVEFTEFVRPIRLWVRDEIPYATAYAMGYGATAFGRSRTNRLTDLNMTIVPNDQCNDELPSLPETENGVIESQICAQDYAMNRDTCQGDSGGPLQLSLFGRRQRNRKHYHLIGITSYGLFCRSEYPSVYTRISAFLDWIEQVVWQT